MSTTTIILAEINRCIRIFREANATNPSNAIIPSEYGINNSFVFRRLVRKGILVPLKNEQYYMDEAKELIYRKRRQSIALVLLMLLVTGVIIAIATNEVVI